MKKLFLISAVTTGLFTSCVQSESIVPELNEAANEIRYHTMVAKQNSRAIVEGTSYVSTAPSFGTYAFINPNSQGPGYQSYITNAEIVYKTEGTTPYWGVKGTSYQWPKTGSVTFYSYSPYYYQEEGHETTPLNPGVPQLEQNGFIFKNYDVDAHQQTDLMVADVKVGQTANTSNGGYTGVPTIFRHKLAMIAGFVLRTSEDYDGNWDGVNDETAKAGDMRFRIWKITLKNILTKGTYMSKGVDSDGNELSEGWSEPNGVANEGGVQVIKDYIWYDVYSDVEEGETANGTIFGHIGTKQLHIAKVATETDFNKKPHIANEYLLVRPQDFGSQSDAAIEIEYTIGTYNGSAWEITAEHITKTVKLSDIHKTTAKDASGNDQVVSYGGWAMNKKIIYTLDFSTTEIRWAPSVEAWEDSDFTVDY